jgi:hypothetical protein
MQKNKRIKSLNTITCAILEDLWKSDPDWIKMIDMNPELKEWLNTVYLEYYYNKTDRQVSPGRSCHLELKESAWRRTTEERNL